MVRTLLKINSEVLSNQAEVGEMVMLLNYK